MLESRRMQEQAVEAVKTVPPTTVGLLTIAGVPLEHWIQLLTVVWLLLLIAGWCWDRIIKPWRVERRAKKRARKAHNMAVIHRMQDQSRHDHDES